MYNIKLKQSKMSKKYDFDYQTILTIFQLKTKGIQHLNDNLTKLYKEYFSLETKKISKLQYTPESDNKLVQKILIQAIKRESFESLKINLDKISNKSKLNLKNILYTISNKISTDQFLQNMSIAYLIIIFEDFLAKNLKLSFFNKPMMLKSETQLNFEEIINLKNYNSIIQEMIERKTKSIIKKDIKDLRKTLLEFFKLDLMNDNDWIRFTEIFYRRNVIVHNEGISDQEYSDKTKNPINVDLTPDGNYIKESIIIFENFSKTISKFFEEKYPAQKLS